MALEREKYLVYLQADDGTPLVKPTVTVHAVTITHQDMQRAEETLGGRGAGGLTLGTAWCWAALTRMGLYDGPYEQFRDLDCVGLEDDGKETVDPTQPEILAPSPSL